MEKKTEFWNNIVLAAEAQPRDITSIKGASGFVHPVVALGIDEERRRVIIVSGESDARSAALAQGDIQASMSGVKVVMVRPAAINLGYLATSISKIFGSVEFGQKELEWINENKDDFNTKMQQPILSVGKVFANFAFGANAVARLDIIPVLKEVLQQLSLLEICIDPDKTNDGNNVVIPTFDLSQLRLLDPVEADRQFGVCSIPLYDFDEDDVETLKSKQDVEFAKMVLKKYDILQYFFPAADQLFLGLADESHMPLNELEESLARTPDEGHPFGELEIVDKSLPIESVLSALREQGLLVEGELNMEVTDSGQSIRSKVKFKPREGLINKLSKIFSVKVDLSLKDLLGKQK